MTFSALFGHFLTRVEPGYRLSARVMKKVTKRAGLRERAESVEKESILPANRPLLVSLTSLLFPFLSLFVTFSQCLSQKARSQQGKVKKVLNLALTSLSHRFVSFRLFSSLFVSFYPV